MGSPVTNTAKIDITGLPGQNDDGNINLADVSNSFNKVVDKKEEAIKKLQDEGDFEDTKTVLLMQQMMNEWSFTLGLSSSLTKTIADSLKGIVQKI
ncbi:EscF/YscF/HrpA family type III secretion system needle major subunit [Thalassomonas sp. RHCl1]|uniref:EscF/YscF/HrpA family type III secretion system needle major subunit n=1 Tax=Thalassomonas sp. RHCl1 TaxID=2995320 RepID=UPI00248B98CD|nr:EscF/YscF/HrpA family type III secretion system needle major subunit [Thalassomonas sp. RHCl1]